MSKEMSVIPVNRVVDIKKNNWKKLKGQGGGEAQGVADTPPPKKKSVKCQFQVSKNLFFFCLFSASKSENFVPLSDWSAAFG
jgi:hypothetical protein